MVSKGKQDIVKEKFQLDKWIIICFFDVWIEISLRMGMHNCGKWINETRLNGGVNERE